jgi:hypothetical protein
MGRQRRGVDVNEPKVTGSVSHGTLRDQDLYPVFFNLYEELFGTSAEAPAFPRPDQIEWGNVDGFDLVSDLMDKVDNRLAEEHPGWRLSNTEGDGSDFGVWKIPYSEQDGYLTEDELRAKVLEEARRSDTNEEARSLVEQCEHLFRRWFDRGDGVAVYENQDLGHPDVGQKQFASFGSAMAQLEVEIPPERLPDIGDAINWRFILVGWHRPDPEA